MNREQFISYLEHPELLTAEVTPQLQNVLKEFPWFQTAQLLYVKNLHNQNSIHYGNQLKIAAAYTSDRTVLYELIGGKKSKEPVVRSLETVIPKVEITEAPKEKKNHELRTPNSELDEVQDFKLKTQESLLKAQELLLESQESLLKTQEIRIKAQEAKLKSLEETPKTEEKKPEEKKKEENGPVVFEEVEKAKVDMAKLNQDILGEAVNSTIGLEVTLIEQEQEQEQEEEKAIDKSKIHSFSEWLKLTSKGTTMEEKEKIVLSELINKFIIEQPSISKPRAEFFSPVDKARESVKENEDIVTETLAKIYEQQGNYAKALKAYEKLSLKYPGKSAFFAARIKEIREKQ